MVTTVFAMLEASMHGQRMVSVALTVLALRLVGKLAHEGRGNKLWDESSGSEGHGWRDDSR